VTQFARRNLKYGFYGGGALNLLADDIERAFTFRLLLNALHLAQIVDDHCGLRGKGGQTANICFGEGCVLLVNGIDIANPLSGNYQRDK